MAQISYITLPNGDTYNLIGSPYFIQNVNMPYHIDDPDGGDTSSDNFWEISLPNIKSLYNGLTIAILVPTDYYLSGLSSSEIQLKTYYNGNNNNTDFLYCRTTENESLTISKVKAFSILFLTYYSDEACWLTTSNNFSTSSFNLGTSISKTSLGSTNLTATSRTNDYKLDLSNVLTNVVLNTTSIDIPDL